MKLKPIISALALLCVSHGVFAANGIALGATRVIYNESNKEASLTVDNHSSKQYFLVQSWVDDKDGNKNVPFSITPPLFRLNANKENMLRIIKTGTALPNDRESVFWVNVKAIPPAPESGSQNVLQLAIKTRIKMFYRPADLPGTAMDSPQALEWSVQGNELVAKNPTAYSVTLDSVKLNGTEIKEVNLVMPKGESHYKLPAGTHGGQLVFTTINDYGGITAAITRPVN
ncbi:fimbria/pilus periplasmic chaperone [Buttiauxella gaviniae]|uniref:Fimbria/pilus periplasmic chaperone n=1 Tax=Buttiauxella gaviniae TaxID=82990 RepID=A0ABV3NYD5_9ENTR